MQTESSPSYVANAHARSLILNDRAADAGLVAEPNSKGFVSLLMTYRASGGTLSREELIQLLVDHRQTDYAGAVSLIGSHRVFGFSWRNKVWVPMFQFELRNLTIRRECHDRDRRYLQEFEHPRACGGYRNPCRARFFPEHRRHAHARVLVRQTWIQGAEQDS